MLTTAEEKIRSFNPAAKVYLWGQELNPQSWATCGSEMLLREQPGSIFGNSFSNDGSGGRRSTTCWPIHRSASNGRRSSRTSRTSRSLGYAGRFGAGLPRINDGSFLFLQHMISKMNPVRARAAGWRSSSTARPCSPGPPGRVSRRSGGGSWRTTGLKGSSRCRTSSSTTPGSLPTSGSCPTGRTRRLRAKSSCSMHGISGRRCASPSGTSGSRSAASRSRTSRALHGCARRRR